MRILVFALAASLSTEALAAEVAVNFDDSSQQAAFQLPALLDQCVAGITMRGDASTCKTVSGALNALAGMVKGAQVKATEEAKKASDKPAEKKPDEAN